MCKKEGDEVYMAIYKPKRNRYLCYLGERNKENVRMYIDDILGGSGSY
jgi:hypothetical protein